MTLHDEVRDEPQHITQSLHGGGLPVDAVAAVTHAPGDECSGNRWTEYDGDQSIAAYKSILVNIAVYESILVNISQTVRQRDGCEVSAISKRTAVKTGNRFRECEGSDPTAITEGIFTNTDDRFRECD